MTSDKIFKKCIHMKAADWYELSRSLNKPYPYTLKEKLDLIVLRDHKQDLTNQRKHNVKC